MHPNIYFNFKQTLKNFNFFLVSLIFFLFIFSIKKMNIDNIAILIDGDNISYKLASQIIDKAKKYGKILISRVYGDFSETELKNWRTPSISLNIEPIIVWRMGGKNSSDIRLTADAIEMVTDIPIINKFILVSGDKDFTTLISKLKIKGKYVIGMASNQHNTSCILRHCCDEFILLEQSKEIKSKAKNKNSIETFDQQQLEQLKVNMINIFEESDEELIHLGKIKEKLLLQDSLFTEQNYGFKSFSKFIKSLDDILEIKTIKSQKYGQLNKNNNIFDVKNNNIPLTNCNNNIVNIIKEFN